MSYVSESIATGPIFTRRRLLQSAALGALATSLKLTPGTAEAQAVVPRETLTVRMAKLPENDVATRTYDRKYCGPTIYTDPGTAFEVRLQNSLRPEPPESLCPEDINTFHGSNATNLHTHGLHVSPNKASTGQDADNIFINLLPLDQTILPGCHLHDRRDVINTYRFELPETHPTGTFWYHAHKHGSTAQQVSDGLLGPLVVRDRPGAMPAYIEAATKKEDILLIRTLGIENEEPNPSNNGGTPHLLLVDPEHPLGAQPDPTIELYPGEVRRWRIINGAPRADAFVSLNLVNDSGGQGIEVYQIAFDGITYERRIEVDTTDNGPPWENPAALAPGNRTDFIIRVPMDAEEGDLRLVALQLPNTMPGMPEMAAADINSPSTELTLNIRIKGAPSADPWSDDPRLPGGGRLTRPITPDEIVPSDHDTEFHLIPRSQTPTGERTLFLIDGEMYDGKVKKEFELGTAEEWRVSNLNTFTHPFHIHVNPFFVTHIYDKQLPEGHPLRRWQDTMAVPTASQDGSVTGAFTCLSRFSEFTGEFVIHCHILDHEDQGMMQKVAVVPAR